MLFYRYLKANPTASSVLVKMKIVAITSGAANSARWCSITKGRSSLVYSSHVLLTSNAQSTLATKLSCCQRSVIELHTGDLALEVAPVSFASSESDGIISSKPDPTDSLPGHKFVVDEKSCGSSAAAVGGRYKVPSFPHVAACCKRRRRTEAAASREPHEQRFGGDIPEVHSPSIRFIVNNRTCASQVVDPSA